MWTYLTCKTFKNKDACVIFFIIWVMDYFFCHFLHIVQAEPSMMWFIYTCCMFALFIQYLKCTMYPSVRSDLLKKIQLFEMVIQSSFLVILVPVVHVAGYINIYHKTKVLLVILRCLKYLNIIWNKS